MKTRIPKTKLARVPVDMVDVLRNGLPNYDTDIARFREATKVLKKMLYRNKRASASDLIWVGITLLFFGMVVLVMFTLSDKINDEFQTNTDIPSAGKTAFNNINNMYSGVIDNMFLVLAVGLSLVAIVLASLVRVHPVFFIFYIMILAIIIFLSAVFSNIYLEMAHTPELTGYADQLTFTTHILGFLPWIVGIVGFLLSVIMYKNWANET